MFIGTFFAAILSSTLFVSTSALAQAPAPAATSANVSPRIHLVWMGGDDCPPCRWWRAAELPKLKASPIFSEVKVSYVVKLVGGAVPPRFFLDDDVKPYKDKLDYANSGRAGSPQAALIVNGEVYDYFGYRSAEEIESMVNAVKTGGKYPFSRCLKVYPIRGEYRCEIPA